MRFKRQLTGCRIQCATTRPQRQIRAAQCPFSTMSIVSFSNVKSNGSPVSTRCNRLEEWCRCRMSLPPSPLPPIVANSRTTVDAGPPPLFTKEKSIFLVCPEDTNLFLSGDDGSGFPCRNRIYCFCCFRCYFFLGWLEREGEIYILCWLRYILS